MQLRMAIERDIAIAHSVRTSIPLGYGFAEPACPNISVPGLAILLFYEASTSITDKGNSVGDTPPIYFWSPKLAYSFYKLFYIVFVALPLSIDFQEVYIIYFLKICFAWPS